METEKKPLPTKIKMIISISILLGVLLAFNQCVLKPSSKKSTSKKLTSKLTNLPKASTGDAGEIRPDTDLPEGLDMPSMNTPVTDSELAELEVGVKNFDQINMTMSQLTGIPTSDQKILAIFKDSSIQLPSDNSIKTFMPSMQVAITKLATEYCDRLVETDDARKVIWPTLNFTQGPSQTLTSANKVILIDETVNRFLGPLDATSINNARTELLALYDMIIAGENMSSSLTTKKVVKGICVASLSSAYVTLL